MQNQAKSLEQAELTALKTAYEQAVYEVYYRQETIRIKIGEYCPALDFLLTQENYFSWALITAANPYSQLLSESENQQRHQLIIKHVTEAKLLFLFGVGRDQTGIWTPEQSLLVLGIERSKAIALGQKFAQNAIVYGELKQPVELQWL